MLSGELDVAQPREVGVNATAVLSQRPAHLRREAGGAGVTQVVEHGARFEHAVAPGLRLVVKDRLCFDGLLQHLAAAAQAALLNPFGRAPKQILATA